MRLTAIFAFLGVMICAAPAFAQQEEIPKNIADSVGETLRWTEGQFAGLAEAMPEEKYSFIPSGGNFKGVRTFAIPVTPSQGSLGFLERRLQANLWRG